MKQQVFRRVAWLLLLLRIQHLCSASNSPQDGISRDSDRSNDRLLDWVLQQGGYWNPKQVMGRDDDGLFGVFANEPIEQGEVLARIPWSVVIAPPRQQRTHRRFDDCDTVQLLKEELEKGNDSQYALYTAALKQTAQDHYSFLPAHWSPQGQALLKQVLNDTLPPQDMFLKELKWKQKCEIIHKEATLLIMTHGEDFGMVPLTDRYNCRGGDWTGAYFSIEGGKGDIALEIRAYVDLEAGEQIYTDYHDYGQIGTPELLRDYGFVDNYPQKYFFHAQKIAFDVNEEGHVHWVLRNLDMRYVDPGESLTSVMFLRQEYQRLSSLCPEIERQGKDMIKQPPSTLTEQELDTTLRFCKDMQIAVGTALVDLGIVDGKRRLQDSEEL